MKLAHSPAKRGTFAGSGWTGLTRSGQVITEQLTLGFTDVPLQDALNTSLPISADATAAARWAPSELAANSAASSLSPSTLVVVDSDGQLIGRMRVEASGVAASVVRGATERTR